MLKKVASGTGVQKDSQLSSLLQESRTQSGRQLLLENGAAQSLPSALKRMTHCCVTDTLEAKQRDMLLWLLHLVRNLCAAGDAACISLSKHGLVDDILLLADKSLQCQPGR